MRKQQQQQPRFSIGNAVSVNTSKTGTPEYHRGVVTMIRDIKDSSNRLISWEYDVELVSEDKNLSVAEDRLKSVF